MRQNRNVGSGTVVASMLFAWLLIARMAPAQVFDEQYDHWPEQLKIHGTLILGGGLEDASLLKTLMPQTEAPLLLIDDQVTDAYLQPLDPDQEDGDEDLKRRLTLDRGDILKGIREAVKAALPEDDKAVQVRPLVVVQRGEFSNTELENWRRQRAEIGGELRQYLARGGALACDHVSCRWIGSAMVSAMGESEPGVAAIPDTLVVPQYQPSQRDVTLRALANHGRTLGIGIPDTAAIVLSGRKIQMAGDGRATFLLAANDRQPAHEHTLVAPQRRLPPEAWMLDWTQWRRRAIDRTLPAFPPDSPPRPFVPNGALVIVGGGGTPRGLMDRIIELAGGKERAKMVYIPCSERDDVGDRQRTVEMWQKMGVKHATFIHTKDRRRANDDPSFYEPLKDATGLWFGGGRQWNFADSYYGTTTHKLMKEVLERGGVVSGSSAGASIQARFLARATPIQNVRILAPGYERGGLGFIGGVAIDQHFSQRGRQKDMTQLVDRYPQLLGIGIDESTAILATKSRAEVIGRGRVYFYDRNRTVSPAEKDYVALPAGSVYDLAGRRTLVHAKQPLPPLETSTDL